MTIYELTEEYQELLALAEDPDVDPQILTDTMDALSGEIELKAEGYGKVIRQMEADSAALKAEIDRLTARKRRAEESVERMKQTLKNVMILIGKPKIRTELFNFSVANNPKKVVIDADLSEIPTCWLIEQEPKIDRKAIKDAIEKEDRTAMSIAHLEQDTGLRMR